ncbi:MAG: hypothetical protein NT013_18910 [Planctomycetia bacterium]|nr:hypothetical protein [Planctomycetia bacterium]
MQKQESLHIAATIRAIIALVAASSIIASALAADRPKPATAMRPVVDQVAVRSGPKLRGMLFAQAEDKSVTLLVSARWLKGANPESFTKQRQKTIDLHKLASEHATDRLDKELGTSLPDPLKAFLKQQRDEIQEEIDNVEKLEPDFLWIALTGREIERIDATTVERRQLLAWAWTEKLDRAETRDVEDLQKELKARAVEPVSWPLSFVERLPARDQTDNEWSARIAVAEYALSTPMDFQGTGDVLIRAGRDVPADFAPLLVNMLRKQLQSQLGDLFGDSRPAPPKNNKAALAESLKTAIQAAEAEKRRSFRVTRMQQSDDLSAVTVTTQFVAKMSDGSWEVVFQHNERADAKQARPDAEQRIQQDPQVKKVLDLTRQLGGAADDQIQQAIRFGAATMFGQSAADREFAAFRDRYLKSLTKPPLNINAKP